MITRILISGLILFGSVGIAEAQQKTDSRKVLDYYKMVPINTLNTIGAEVLVNDPQNGYLKIGAEYNGWTEVALYRRKDRSALIVVGDTLCTPACGTTLSAFELVNGKMVSIAENIFPRRDQELEVAKANGAVPDVDLETPIYQIELPRHGTTIKVSDPFDNLVYKIEWKNGTFLIERSVLGLFYVHPESEFASIVVKKDAEILVNDNKNGYLKIKTNTATIDARLFRKTDGTPVFLYVNNYCGRPACVTSDITAKEYIDGEWNDVTDRVLPDYESMEKKVYSKYPRTVRFGYQYKVPRVGTIVKIVEGANGKTLYRLTWENDKFQLK